MKNLIFLALLALVFSSCSSNDFKTKAVEAIGNASGVAVAKALDCKDVDAVRRDIKSQLNKLNIFKEEKESKAMSLTGEKGIGSSICTVAVTTVLPGLLDFGAGQLPSDWECSGDGLNTSIEKLAQSACQYIQF